MRNRRRGLEGLGYIMRDKAVEILRLWEAGFSKSAISESVKVHRQTVRNYISEAKVLGLKSADLESMAEARYQELFCKSRRGRTPNTAELNYEYICVELRKSGVTLLLLWEEYLSANREGCSYSTFCNRYLEWAKTRKLSMRARLHKDRHLIRRKIST